MRIGIMQPYFMPYIGYFSLIKHVDLYILFDSVQFIRHGWVERNRILKQTGGWQYISVPLEKHSRDTIIKDIRINNDIKWKEKIIAQLTHYKKAPYYCEVINLLKQLFKEDYEDIVSLNLSSLKLICSYIGINTPISIFSKMDIEVNSVQEADEWALEICKKIPGTKEYWNAIGGINFFDRNKYTSANIDLKFQKVNLEIYKQKGDTFEPGLSIIDVMMFNSNEEINKMLDKYEIL